MSGYAPHREDGLYPYVVEKAERGKTYTRIVWSGSLKEARSEHGKSKVPWVDVRVRRATVEDMEGSP